MERNGGTVGLDLRQFDKYVVEPVLRLLDPDVPYTANGKAITIETCFHESGGLTYIAQVGGGPARGVGQCEWPTYYWLMDDYLPKQKPKVFAKVSQLSGSRPIPFEELTWNLRLSVALVRCRYLPDPHVIPNTIEARAAYWGRVYQTTSDPVKMQRYIDDARRLA